jgi:hypothetical protein
MLKSDFRVLVRSAEGLAYALRDAIDILADHERRIRLIEERVGLAVLDSRVLKAAAKAGAGEGGRLG